MSVKSHSALFLVAGVLICRIIGATASESHSQQSENNSNHEDPPPLKVAKFDFERVSGPLIIIVWILIASLAKLGTLKSFLRPVMICYLKFHTAVNMFRLMFTYSVFDLCRFSFISQVVFNSTGIMVSLGVNSCSFDF